MKCSRSIVVTISLMIGVCTGVATSWAQSGWQKHLIHEGARTTTAVAGDFSGDGCDTVSVYRPSNLTVYIFNSVGSGGAGLGAADIAYAYGESGDSPFSGDFDGDGVTTVGVYRPGANFVYLRNSNTYTVASPI